MSSRRRTVLVVEDAGSCATTLEIALGRMQGTSVLVVSSAEEARGVLEGNDLVCALVTDLNLPEASGLELIGWVRSRGGLARLPVVVISGDSDPGVPAAILSAGADAFFAKPFSPAAVRQKVEDLIHAESDDAVL